MATSQTEKLTNVNPDVAPGTAQFLSPLVIDLEALVVNGKQAHWHLRGHNFIGVHELLDTLVSDAQEWADLAAERVVALGLPVDSRLATVAAKTTLPELSAGFQQSEDTIVEVVAMLDAAIQTARTAVDELDEIDLNSQDVAVEIVRGLEKDRWLLLAHVAK
ncbi:Dps family protein [Paramicrobacterium agarici]|uniref:Starvation-inducible DNA-binding protein n=1 Tax=Paramicrobacterium agarici TaxID=630514 RepID=A0A2A9DXS4_9MICO|nr:DNA starvation/stationary phase protection protein [Microbacterium agarici]PFG31141.1 starvation-inducible DNA-binding protein [Microbacterium agarici]